MQMDFAAREIKKRVIKQLDHLFLFDPAIEQMALEDGANTALEKCKICFSATTNKYYHRGGQACFNPFHKKAVGRSLDSDNKRRSLPFLTTVIPTIALLITKEVGLLVGRLHHPGRGSFLFLT